MFGIFTKTVEQIKIWLKLYRNYTLHEDLCVVMITSHCFISSRSMVWPDRPKNSRHRNIVWCHIDMVRMMGNWGKTL